MTVWPALVLIAGLACARKEPPPDRSDLIRFATKANQIILDVKPRAKAILSATDATQGARACLDGYGSASMWDSDDDGFARWPDSLRALSVFPHAARGDALYPAVSALELSVEELYRRWRVACLKHYDDVHAAEPIAVRRCAAVCRDGLRIVLQMLDGVREVGRAAGVEIEPLRGDGPQKR
jgi:hypothetical protein